MILVRLQKRIKTLNLNQNLDRRILIFLRYSTAGDGGIMLGIKVEPLISAYLFVIDRLDFFHIALAFDEHDLL